MKNRFYTLLILTFPIILLSANSEFNETPEAREARMAWWKEARFGMFIHWGLYAVPAGIYEGKNIDYTGEWIMNSAPIPVAVYEKYALQFNPVQFDAESWAGLARDAGMKYLVITSKHHDGFCLWDSQVTEYDIMDATPFKRDILKELSAACKKYNVRFCLYHSIMDWHHPDAQRPFFPQYNGSGQSNPGFPDYVEFYMKPQLKELLTGYGPLGVLWFDGEWIPEWTNAMGLDLYRFVRGFQPEILMNNRLGQYRAGMSGFSEDGDDLGDFGTPEQEVPSEGLPGVDWESCMTMNDTWGYRSDDQNWKSDTTLIWTLVETASKGGNFLLNVGPTAEGLIPQASVDRLHTMGQWLRVNGEAIYKTTMFRTSQEGETLRFTQRPEENIVYAIHLGCPGEVLRIQSVPVVPGSKLFLLGYEPPLNWRQEQGTVTVYIPESVRQHPPNKIAWVLKMHYRSYTEAPKIIAERSTSIQKPIQVILENRDPDADLFYSLESDTEITEKQPVEGPLQLSRSTVVHAWAEGKDKAPSLVVQKTFSILDSLKQGLQYTCYEGKWDKLPYFKSLEPVRQGWTFFINPAAVKTQDDHFGIVYRGNLRISREGLYTFHVRSDDGSRLLIDNQKILENDGLHAPSWGHGSARLEAGLHPFELQFFDGAMGDVLEMEFSGPGIPRQPVPPHLFIRND